MKLAAERMLFVLSYRIATKNASLEKIAQNTWMA